MIIKSTFKGTQAIELHNEKLKVLVLPRIGGKIASFYYKEKAFELLDQYQGEVYQEADFNDAFEAYDISGFDDCFPSIDYSIETYAKQTRIYPDHGEIWSARLDASIVGEELHLYYESKMLPYSFEKVLYLNDNALMIKIKITNMGQEAIEGFYTPHCLIRCEKDMELIFPEKTRMVVNVIESTYLGEVGSKHTFPVSKDVFGENYRLNRIFSKHARKCEKYYVLDTIKEGRCGVYYPSKDITYELTYDVDALPYFGFWVSEGGFKHTYNCALEPSGGFYDSMPKARENNKFTQILPNATFEVVMKMCIS